MRTSRRPGGVGKREEGRAGRAGRPGNGPRPRRPLKGPLRAPAEIQKPTAARLPPSRAQAAGGSPPPAQGRGNGVWAPVQPADLRLGEGADGPPARPGLPGTWGHRSLGAEPALMPLGPLTHSHQAHPGAGTPFLGAFQSRERAPKSRRAAVLPRPGRRPGGLPGKSDISQAWGGWEHGKWLVCAGRWRCQGHGLRAGPGVSWPFPLPSLPRATESG